MYGHTRNTGEAKGTYSRDRINRRHQTENLNSNPNPNRRNEHYDTGAAPYRTTRNEPGWRRSYHNTYQGMRQEETNHREQRGTGYEARKGNYTNGWTWPTDRDGRNNILGQWENQIKRATKMNAKNHWERSENSTTSTESNHNWRKQAKEQKATKKRRKQSTSTDDTGPVHPATKPKGQTVPPARKRIKTRTQNTSSSSSKLSTKPPGKQAKTKTNNKTTAKIMAGIKEQNIRLQSIMTTVLRLVPAIANSSTGTHQCRYRIDCAHATPEFDVGETIAQTLKEMDKPTAKNQTEKQNTTNDSEGAVGGAQEQVHEQVRTNRDSKNDITDDSHQQDGQDLGGMMMQSDEDQDIMASFMTISQEAMEAGKRQLVDFIDNQIPESEMTTLNKQLLEQLKKIVNTK